MRDEPSSSTTRATRAKETFVPADPSSRVERLVCRPTVYGFPQLAHAKTYTQFDFLARLPRTRGFAVTCVQKITDVDDKIIRRARELRIDASELACMYERAYPDDMRALRNDSVDVYARASDYIDQVISQIERLQQAGATPARRAVRRGTARDHSSLGGSTRTSLPRPRPCAIAHGLSIWAYA
jgi:cysteinyl-tRNA synthetase